VRGDWQLKKNGKEPAIVTGDEGFISKDFKAIRSKGHASLSQGTTKLTANELVLSADKPITARGNATAKLANGSIVNAAELLIYESGEVKARGSVAVTTSKVVVHAQDMLVEAGADHKPKLAKFKGNPYIVQDGRTIYAESIIYDFSTEQAVIEGNVRSQK
jgi:lipopolysaccharide export system protein LptA